MSSTTEPAFTVSAKVGQLVAITETISADLLTPLSAYLRIAKDSKRSFLLESVEGGEQLARYSFLGADPVMEIRSRGGKTFVTDDNGEREAEGNAVDVLRREFSGRMLTGADAIAPMAGGCVGYLSYGAAKWFDPAMTSVEAAGDDAHFLIFRTVLAFDHARQQIQIRTLAEVSDGMSEQEKQRAFDAAQVRNREIVQKLSAAVELALQVSRVGTSAEPEFESNFTREEFEHAVEQGKELIAAGECYQVVLSQRFKRQTSADAVSLYRALRMTNPSPYMFLLNFGERVLIGASPEMLVRCRGKELTYRPIAGTRPRGTTPEHDVQLAEELRCDEKECAEHMMLVDLGRNDLGRVSRYGSVSVARLLTVEKYSHVQHLVTELHAKLRDELDRFDALGACFPAGTVTGAPKIRAMQAIADLERGSREVYSGAVLYADYAGNLDSCIAIRTMELQDGEVSVQAGAGIVADSIPANEWEETLNKSRALRRAVALAEARE